MPSKRHKRPRIERRYRLTRRLFSLAMLEENGRHRRCNDEPDNECDDDKRSHIALVGTINLFFSEKCGIARPGQTGGRPVAPVDTGGALKKDFPPSAALRLLTNFTFHSLAQPIGHVPCPPPRKSPAVALLRLFRTLMRARRR